MSTHSMYAQVYSSSDKGLSLTLNVTGGVAGSLTLFILPGFIGLALLDASDSYRPAAWTLVAIGVWLPFLIVFASIYWE